MDAKVLGRLGSTLKKNNVAVDVVSFGDTEVNTEKLTEFVKAVNSNDNRYACVVNPLARANKQPPKSSHLVTIEPNTRALTDVLRSSPIHGGGGGGGEGGSGASDFPFGIDPNEDPELLLVWHFPSPLAVALPLAHRLCVPR